MGSPNEPTRCMSKADRQGKVCWQAGHRDVDTKYLVRKRHYWATDRDCGGVGAGDGIICPLKKVRLTGKGKQTEWHQRHHRAPLGQTLCYASGANGSSSWLRLS